MRLRRAVKIALITLWLFASASWGSAPGDCQVPSAQYSAIQAAINDRNCDTINVAGRTGGSGGVYRETLKITRELALRWRASNPTEDKPVIEGTIYILNAKAVIISGFKITTGGAAAPSLGISVQDSASVVITDNEISKSIGDGVQLINSSAEIRGNTISESNGHGISVTLGSKAVISGNIVSANAKVGISLNVASIGVIVANTISDNRSDGISVSASTADIVANKRIIRNEGCGIRLKDSSATGSGNILFGNKVGAPLSPPFPCGDVQTLQALLAQAVRVPADFTKIQEAIDAAGEGFKTIAVSPGIYDGLRIGKEVTLKKDGLGEVIIGVNDPSMDVISIENAQGVVLEGLKIQGGPNGSRNGVRIINSGVQIKDSVITNNGSGLFISDGVSDVTISKSSIFKNNGPGIFISFGGQTRLLIEDNTQIGANAAAGIASLVPAEITIRGPNTSISGNQGSGISISDSLVKLQAGTSVSNNGLSGIDATTSSILGVAQVDISNGVTISSNKVNGIVLSGSARATIANGTISGDSFSRGLIGILLKESATANITGSVIEKNDIGLCLKDKAVVDISRSRVFDNKLKLPDPAQRHPRDGCFKEERAVGVGAGVMVLNEALLRLSDSKGIDPQLGELGIFSNGGDGVRAEGEAGTEVTQVSISRSSVSKNGGDGISLRLNLKAVITDNEIKNNERCGVSVSELPKVEGSGNEMGNNRGGDLCPNPARFPPNFKKS